MLLCLLVLFAIILILAYYFNDFDFLSPSVLFALGFFGCALVAFMASEMWAYEMSDKAFAVLFFGVLLFTLVATVVHVFCTKRSEEHGKSNWRLPISRASIVCMGLLMIITLFLSIDQISQMYPSSNLTRSIALYNNAAKFTEEGVDRFAFPLGSMRSICASLGYLASFLMVQEIISKHHGNAFLLAIVVMLAMANSLVTGSRTSAVGYLFSILVIYILLRRLDAGRMHVLTIASFAGVVAFIVVFTLSFQTMGQLLGRANNIDALEYLGTYIGAQIPNLDRYLNSQNCLRRDLAVGNPRYAD